MSSRLFRIRPTPWWALSTRLPYVVQERLHPWWLLGFPRWKIKASSSAYTMDALEACIKDILEDEDDVVAALYYELDDKKAQLARNLRLLRKYGEHNKNRHAGA